MERLVILVGRLYKSVAPTKYLFKVPLVGRFMPFIGVIHWPVESPLYPDPPFPKSLYPPMGSLTRYPTWMEGHIVGRPILNHSMARTSLS